MEIPVLIEPVAGNGYVAKIGAPLVLNAEGATRDEAMTNLRLLVNQRLKGGGEMATLTLAGSSHGNPWVEFAGMFDPDDPLVQEWIEIMAENRRKADEEPDLREPIHPGY